MTDLTEMRVFFLGEGELGPDCFSAQLKISCGLTWNSRTGPVEALVDKIWRPIPAFWLFRHMHTASIPRITPCLLKIGWLVGWLVERSIDRSIWLIDWLDWIGLDRFGLDRFGLDWIGLIDWFDWLIGWLIDWWIDWSIDRSIDWLIDRLIDWLSD